MKGLSMATYSNNVTQKIGVPVGQSVGDNGSATYTVPAGSYLILTGLRCTSGGGKVADGSASVSQPNGTSGASVAAGENKHFDLHFPQGSVINIYGGTTLIANGSAGWDGLLFTNTP